MGKSGRKIEKEKHKSFKVFCGKVKTVIQVIRSLNPVEIALSSPF